jgi:hypothetical protein
MPCVRRCSCPPGRINAETLRDEWLRPSSSTSLRRTPVIPGLDTRLFSTPLKNHNRAQNAGSAPALGCLQLPSKTTVVPGALGRGVGLREVKEEGRSQWPRSASAFTRPGGHERNTTPRSSALAQQDGCHFACRSRTQATSPPLLCDYTDVRSRREQTQPAKSNEQVVSGLAGLQAIRQW